MAARKRRNPQGLGPAGRRLFAELSEYDFEPGERDIAEQAARSADDLARMGAALVDQPLLVPGSRGQDRAHPLITEIRAHRLMLARLLRQLDVPDDEQDAA